MAQEKITEALKQAMISADSKSDAVGASGSATGFRGDFNISMSVDMQREADAVATLQEKVKAMIEAGNSIAEHVDMTVLYANPYSLAGNPSALGDLRAKVEAARDTVIAELEEESEEGLGTSVLNAVLEKVKGFCDFSKKKECHVVASRLKPSRSIHKDPHENGDTSEGHAPVERLLDGAVQHLAMASLGTLAVAKLPLKAKNEHSLDEPVVVV